LALLSLSQIQLSAVRMGLKEEVSTHPGDFGAMFAYAALNETTGIDDQFVTYLTKNIGRCPDVPLLLPTVDPHKTLNVIMDLVPQSGTLGQANLAIALSRLDDVDHPAVFNALLEKRDPWVTVFCLAALERLGDPVYFPILERIYREQDSEFIRVHAVRTAGFLDAEISREFCLEVVGGGSDPERARALESLVRLGYPRDKLHSIASSLITSRSIKARVNAVLAIRDLKERAVVSSLREMVFSEHPVSRLEGAYCFGYFRDPRAFAFLATLAAKDPVTDVRLQAIKSLIKFPPQTAWEALQELICDPDTRISTASARVLTRYGTEEGTVVLEGLLKLAARTDLAKANRALILKTLGHLAGRGSDEAVRDRLVQSLASDDAATAFGALEAWKMMPPSSEPEVMRLLEKWSSASDARLSSNALVSLFLAGRLDAADRLGVSLGAASSRDRTRALHAVTEVAFMIPRAPVLECFPALFDALSAVDLRNALATASPVTISATSGEFVRDGIADDRVSQDDALWDEEETVPMDMEPASPDEGFDDSSAADLVKHLAKPRVRKTTSFALSTLLAPVGPSRLEPVLQFIRQPFIPILFGMIVVLGLLAKFVGSFTPSEGGTGANAVRMASRFRVEQVRGEATIFPRDHDAVPAALIEEGDSLRVQGQGEVLLFGLFQDRIRLRGESRISFLDLKKKNESFTAEIGLGNYMFDARNAGQFEIHFRLHRISGRKALVYFFEREKKFLMHVQMGSVNLGNTDGSSRVVAASQQVSLAEEGL